MKSRAPPKPLGQRKVIDLSVPRLSFNKHSVRSLLARPLTSLSASSNDTTQAVSSIPESVALKQARSQNFKLDEAVDRSQHHTLHTITSNSGLVPVTPQSHPLARLSVHSSQPSQPISVSPNQATNAIIHSPTSESVPQLPPAKHDDQTSTDVETKHTDVNARASSVDLTSEARDVVKIAPRSPVSSVSSESKSSTLIGTASSKPSVDLKIFEYLSHNGIPFESSPIEADTTVQFLRSQHDHHALRNTESQKSATSRAKREAKFFSNASKSQDLILAARQKLEGDRHRKFVDLQFHELDEQSRFSNRYPLLVNRGLWLAVGLMEIGLISTALSVATIINRAKEGHEVLLLGEPELAWMVASVVVVGCGFLLACILLFKDGAFLCIKNRDIFGLHEVTRVHSENTTMGFERPHDLESGKYYDQPFTELSATKQPFTATGIRQPGRDSFRNSTLVHPPPSARHI